MSVPPRLTKEIVEALPVPDFLPNGKPRTPVYPFSGAKVQGMEAPKGFGVRVTSYGGRAYVQAYWVNGNEHQATIGKCADLSPLAAIRGARKIKEQVAAGNDPVSEKRAAAEAERKAVRVAWLCEEYEAAHLPKKRPTSQRDDKAMIRTIILPKLGKLKVAEVRHKDIEVLHRELARTTPYRANRVAALLSKMFALAVKWELRTDNPAKGIERAPEEKRERFLSPAEIAKLSGALAAHPEQSSANAVRLLLLTGARRGEVLGATWDQFDIPLGVWTKPAATTKQKKLHRVPLSAPALQLLSGMRAEFDRANEERGRHSMKPLPPFLFHGKDGRPQQDIKHFWSAVCRTAGLDGVRVHDLRHTHASMLASLGMSLPIIGALLGHTQAATTARYAHLLDDPLRAATERVGALVTGGKSADVVPLKGAVA
jgi:integrase